MDPTMKRSGNTPGLALANRQSVPEKSDSQAAAVTKRTREQLIDRLIGGACKVTGARSKETADRIIVQVAGGLVRPKPKGANEQLIKAFAAIAEMAPQNATEAMLATQIIATNDAALMFLQRATLENQTFEGTDANVLRATRLMRVFTEQLEALQKLRGKAGQQKVTVEHVHVHDGGQAIVGTVTARGPGRGWGMVQKTDETPHGKRRGWLKNGNAPDDFSKAARCGAKNRRGTACQSPAMPNGRCRLHGGLSTGAKTAEGIERIRRAVTKHGGYSKQAREERDYYRKLLQQCRETLAAI